MNALWTPSPGYIQKANLTGFIEGLNKNRSAPITTYQELHRWSIEHRSEFWEAVWRFTGVLSSRKYDEVLVDGDKLPGAQWFTGSQLNFAENLMRLSDESIAIVSITEDGSRCQLTFKQLHERVAGIQASLIDAGIRPGDRIAGYLPNITETVIAMLATTSLGAVWSSCSPDFGVNGVLDRLGQIRPRILFTTDQYQYNGKVIPILDRVEQIIEQLPTVEKVVVLYTGDDSVPVVDERLTSWNEFEQDVGNRPVRFTQVDFAHPLYIMYSSGTTGAPKCIVHSVGGTLIQHLKEHQLHVNLTPEDQLFYFTTCGWMMWNWLVTGLATGATLILYDGSPFYPGPDRMFQLIDDEDITIFGTSAKFLSAVEKSGFEPGGSQLLTSLRTILSTGSPLAAESFRFVYDKIKQDVCLSSIAGGTDLISCFVLGNPLLPVHEGEIQCAGLGMDVQVFSERGESLHGEKGELVCTRAFPAVPIGFLNDPDGNKFHHAYFDRFPNIWAHGDFIEVSENGGYTIHGRSDAVLNPGGVRIGTSEIYRQVEQIEVVLESLAIGQDWDNDTRVVLFVVLTEGTELDEELVSEIKQKIRTNTTPRHVPAKVIQVTDIPRTISGKITELAVRKIIHNEVVDNTDALANPEALDEFRNLKQLLTD